jgi:hypothetical protein
MEVETVEQFLARGGRITVCPGFGGGSSFLHRGVVREVRRTSTQGWVAILRDDKGHKATLAATKWQPETPVPKVGDVVVFDSAVNGRGLRYCTIARPEKESAAG